MKNLKRTLCIITIGMGIILSAQPATTKDKRIDQMKKELNLSADQSTKIEQINAKYEAEEKGLREKMDVFREKAKDTHEKERQEIRAILNAEQQKKWDEKQKEFEAKRKDFKENFKQGKNGAPQPHPEHDGSFNEKTKDGMLKRMKEDFNLTSAQEEKIKTIHEKYKNPEAAATREKLHKLHDQKRTEIDAILTAEQKEKLKNMRADRRKMHQAK